VQVATHLALECEQCQEGGDQVATQVREAPLSEPVATRHMDEVRRPSSKKNEQTVRNITRRYWYYAGA